MNGLEILLAKTVSHVTGHMMKLLAGLDLVLVRPEHMTKSTKSCKPLMQLYFKT